MREVRAFRADRLITMSKDLGQGLEYWWGRCDLKAIIPAPQSLRVMRASSSTATYLTISFKAITDPATALGCFDDSPTRTFSYARLILFKFHQKILLCHIPQRQHRCFRLQHIVESTPVHYSLSLPEWILGTCQPKRTRQRPAFLLQFLRRI